MRENQLTPYQRRSPAVRNGDPFAQFRQEMDRLFDDFFAPAHAGLGQFEFTPAFDVTETDKEVRLSAELPGVEEKDVGVSLDNDLLTVRGEKRSERKEDGENRRLIERSYGSFERSIRLPFTPEDSACNAQFKNGVLTVTVVKPKGAAASAKHIPIAKN